MRLTSLADLDALYAARGGETYGEDVTQLDHALQSAALAEASGAAAFLVAAALLHDVGHLLAGGDDAGHAATGADALATLFGDAVCGPIALHVAAKRWLCATDAAYHAALSPASQASLVRQGGGFDPAGAARFIALPHAAAAVALRRWDDSGKRDGGDGRPFAHYLPLLAGLARTPRV